MGAAIIVLEGIAIEFAGVGLTTLAFMALGKKGHRKDPGSTK